MVKRKRKRIPKAIMGSEAAPGAIEIYVDGVPLAPGRTRVGLFLSDSSPTGYRVEIVTNPDDPAFQRDVEAAKHG